MGVATRDPDRRFLKPTTCNPLADVRSARSQPPLDGGQYDKWPGNHRYGFSSDQLHHETFELQVENGFQLVGRSLQQSAAVFVGRVLETLVALTPKTQLSNASAALRVTIRDPS